MTQRKRRTARAEAHISDREDRLLERAANEQDRTRAGFVRHAVREELRRSGYLRDDDPAESLDITD